MRFYVCILTCKECSMMYINTTRNMCTHINICTCLFVYLEYFHVQRGGIDLFCTSHTHCFCLYLPFLHACRARSVFLPFPSLYLSFSLSPSHTKTQYQNRDYWRNWLLSGSSGLADSRGYRSRRDWRCHWVSLCKCCSVCCMGLTDSIRNLSGHQHKYVRVNLLCEHGRCVSRHDLDIVFMYLRKGEEKR